MIERWIDLSPPPPPPHTHPLPHTRTPLFSYSSEKAPLSALATAFSFLTKVDKTYPSPGKKGGVPVEKSLSP